MMSIGQDNLSVLQLFQTKISLLKIAKNLKKLAQNNDFFIKDRKIDLTKKVEEVNSWILSPLG